MGFFRTLFSQPAYETMDEQEFLEEALRIFEVRISLEQVRRSLRSQASGVAASDWEPALNRQLEELRIEKTLDCGNFFGAETMKISIIPKAKFGDKMIQFENHLWLDGEEVRTKKITEKVEDCYSELRLYIKNMDDHYHWKLSRNEWIPLTKLPRKETKCHTTSIKR